MDKATRKQQSRLDDIREEDQGLQQDENIPQLNSPTSSQVLVTNHQICYSGKGPKSTSNESNMNTHSRDQESDSDDAVTSKTEEIIQSDGDTSESEDRDSPQYTNASSDDEENHQNKIAP